MQELLGDQHLGGTLEKTVEHQILVCDSCWAEIADSLFAPLKCYLCGEDVCYSCSAHVHFRDCIKLGVKICRKHLDPKIFADENYNADLRV